MTVLIYDGFSRTTSASTLIGDAEGGTDTNKTWAANYETWTSQQVDGSQLLLTHNTDPYNTLVGDNTTKNIDIYAEVSNFGPLDVAVSFKSFRLGLRKTARFNGYIFQWINDQDTTDTGVLDIQRVDPSGPTYTRIGALVVKTRDSAFKMRCQVETRIGAVALRLRYWASGAEPSTWNLERFDTSASRLLTGAYGLEARNSSSVHMLIDNFTVQELVVPVQGTVPQHAYLTF